MALLTGFPSATGQGDTSVIDTAQKVPLGQIQQDAAGNEYIYLKGVASLVAGDWVSYDNTYATTRLLSTGGGGPVAVAMAAILATQFGWFQISGETPSTTNIATNASGAGLGLYASATAGRATTTAAAGKSLFGAVAQTNPATNAGVAHVSRAVFFNQSTL